MGLLVLNGLIHFQEDIVLVLYPIILLTETVSWRCSVEKRVTRNFTNTTGKHLSQSFFKKVTSCRAAALLKKEIPAKVFS